MARAPKEIADEKAVMAKPKPAIDHDLIRDLAKLLDETGLSEIEIEQNGLRLRVGRQASGGGGGNPTHAPPPPVAAPAPLAVPGIAPADAGKHPGIVSSPM